MGKQIKILWHSDPMWHGTGYSNQTNMILPRIKDRFVGKIDVAVTVTTGLGGAPIGYNGVLHFPSIYNNDHGIGTIGTSASSFGADIVITFKDLFVYSSGFHGKIPWSPIFPIHYDRLPPVFRELLKESVFPASYSKWAIAKAKECGYDLEELSHGIDLNIFRNLGNKDRFKEILGFSGDCFLVGMVAMNTGYPSRKSFPESLEAFGRFQKTHKDACLYMHTDPIGLADGIDLASIVKELEIKNVRFANPSLLYSGAYGEEYLCQVYNAIDVLLSPSKGEGFGIPIVESQACGTPVIVNDWSSMPELVGDGWICEREHNMEFLKHMAYQAIPKIESIQECLEKSYDRGSVVSDKAMEFARNYDIDSIFDKYFVPYLDKIYEFLS